MIRTSIQITALLWVLMSSFFLIRNSITLKIENMIKLSQTPFGGTYKPMLKNLTQQKADTTVGFVLLLASFVLSLINFLWPMRYSDFGVNLRGVIIAVVVSLPTFIIVYIVSCCLQQKWYKQCVNISKKPKDEQNNK